jgi:ParB-like chromosome segregation protein Spo0J
MHPVYEFHPLAAIFPVMAEPEIAELAADIKANGLRVPIVLYEGKILDGRNRYLACVSAGLEPQFTEYEGDQPIQYSLSLNLHRRHLTTSQRAAVAADVANLEPGGVAGIHTNAQNCAFNPIRQSRAAAALSVSRRSVQQAVAHQEG